SGRSPLVFDSGDYDARFELDGELIQYKLKYEKRRVIAEELKFKGRLVLRRGRKGSGRIWFPKAQTYRTFQTHDNQLAAVARRDSIQHQYFEFLFQWANHVRLFQFGTPLGKDVIDVLPKGVPPDFNPADTSQTTRLFRVGVETYGKPFKDAIKKDMALIGYKL